ncbi:MAG: tetratricopeptide repeat protein, partial [bacterium]|nr:tetratricopeptide repeat protein [bacterium]
AGESCRQALELSPDSSQPRALRAGAYRDLGRPDQAREAYAKAVAVNPASGHAHLGLAKLAKERNDTVEKNQHLRACERLIPGDDWVVREVALRQEERNPAKGIERRTAVLAENPDDVGNLIGLARLHAKLQETAPAKEYYAKARTLYPQNLSLGWEVAEFHRQTGDKNEALRILIELVNAQEEPAIKANAQLFIGRFYSFEELHDRADAAFLAAADTSETPVVCARVGSYFYTTGRYEEALSWMDKGLGQAEASPESDPRFETLVREMRGARIETLTALKRFEEALKDHEQYEALYPDSSAGLQLRGEIAAQSGEVSAAIHYYNLFLEKDADDSRALFRRAGLFRGQGNWQRAIADLEQLKATAPDALKLEPRLLLARAYERTGRYDLAASEMETLMEENAESAEVGGIAWTLVVLYNRHHDYDRSARVVAKMRNRQPDVARWPFLLGDIALRRSDEALSASEAQSAVKNLLNASKLADFNPQFVARLMEGYVKFKAHDEGIAFYEGILPPNRRHAVVTLHYATLLAQAGRNDDAVAQFRIAAMAQERSGFPFFQAMVAAIVETMKPDAALGLLRNQPDDPDLRLANQKILAFLLASIGQASEAETVLRDILAASSGDGNTQATAYSMLGILAEQAGDFEKSREAYEGAVEADPQNWTALNNLAYLLSSKLGEHEAALRHARKAVLINAYPAVLDTVGSVLIELGNYREAISNLDEAVRIDPLFVPAYTHLADAYRRLGEFETAEAHLRDAQKIIDEFKLHADEAESIKAVLEKARNRDRSS